MKKKTVLAPQTYDFLILVGIILAAIPITIYGNLNFLESTLLFFGVPSAYLIWQNPRNIKKATIAGLILGVLLGFSFDFVAEFNNAWGWSTDFALPAQLFGIVSLDILIWFFLWVFLAVAYYEHFIEHDKSTKISPHAKWVVLGGLILAAIVVLEWHFFPRLLELNYAYATLGTMTLVTCGLLLFRRPQLIHKVLQMIPFFTFMYLAYEITALSLNLWNFPGAYLGSVSVGDITFPLEELLVWIIASSAVVATYYEFAIDDEK